MASIRRKFQNIPWVHLLIEALLVIFSVLLALWLNDYKETLPALPRYSWNQ